MSLHCHDDLHQYAALPLQHMAQSLSHLRLDRPVHLTWNSMRLDLGMPHDFFLGSDPVLCMETPLFGRHLWQFDGRQDPERIYYRIALWDPSVLYGGFHIEANRARRMEMFDRLGIQDHPWREPTDGPILYILQVPGDTSRKGVDVFTAAVWDLYELKRRTARPVTVVVHPDCWEEYWAKVRLEKEHAKFRLLLNVALSLGYSVSKPGERTADYLEGAHCCVGYTSGTLTEALMAGVPCVALHRGNFAYPLCDHSLERIAWPYRGDRSLWWDQLAHIQYSWAEIERGEHLETISTLLSL